MRDSHRQVTASWRRRVALVVAACAAAVCLPAGSAWAAKLDGPWAPFSHCPVDAPEMIESPPTTFGTGCIATSSPRGEFAIGDMVVKTGQTEVQFGVAGSGERGIPATEGRTLVAAPVKVPGGLLGIEVPELLAPVFDLLDPLLGVTATVELAGDVTDFDATGVFGPGIPILTLPVKIRLQNPLLGSNCTIGSDANPILLRPQTITPGTPSAAVGGPGVFILTFTGGTLGDDSFAVPGAEGCGPLGLLDPLVDQQVGLPSAEGRNRIVLEDVTAATALSQQGGAVLAEAWHNAVIED